MRQLLKMRMSAVLVLMLTLAGCGGSSSKAQSSSTPTSAGQDPAVAPGTPPSPAARPRDGGVVPPGPPDLGLFMRGADGDPAEKPRIYWAVAGLQPPLKGVAA